LAKIRIVLKICFKN